MARVKLKDLLLENHKQREVNEIHVPLPNIDGEVLVHIVSNLGLPAWTALPLAIATVASTAFAMFGGYELSKTIKTKLERRRLTPEEAERFAIEVETAIKDIPGKQRAYLTQLLNKYKQALAAEAGGLDNITNISAGDAKDIMISHMKELKRRLPELDKK